MTKPAEVVAREEYGDLIEKIVAWPPGLGIDVHLIGGAIVQYGDEGKKLLTIQHDEEGEPVVDRTPIRVRMLRAVSALRGWRARQNGGS